MIKKFNTFLDAKHKIYTLIIIFLWFIFSLLEIIGISSVPVLISLLLDDTRFFEIFFLNDLKLKIIDYPKEKVLLFFSIFLIFFFLLKNLFTAFLINLELNIYRKINVNIKKRIFSYYLNIPYSEYLKLNSPTIIRIVSEDTSLAIGFLISYLTIVSQIILLSLSLILLLYWNFNVTILILLVFSILFFSIYLYSSKKIYKIGKIKQEYTKDILKIITNSIDNIKEVIIYSKENFLTSLFENKQYKTQEQILKISLYKKIPKLFYEFLGLSLIVVVILFYLFIENSIDEVIIFISLLAITILRILPAMNLLTQNFSTLKSSEYSFNLIIDIFKKTKNDTLEKNFLKSDYIDKKIEFKKDIEFKNIYFSYPQTNERSIKNFNLKIGKNSTVGVVGKSGSGKSTFINLLAGLLKPSNGEISIDGKSIIGREHFIQKKIGYIPQDNYLVDDTILKNIIFSNKMEDVDNKKIEKVLAQSQLKDFIKGLKDGIQTNVGEKGIRISGGQRQRIGIARALYNEPEILIFDESFNSLDTLTEAKLVEEIYKIKDKTIIIISHKLETLYNCDKVILIENGQIKDSGTPKEIQMKFVN